MIDKYSLPFFQYGFLTPLTRFLIASGTRNVVLQDFVNNFQAVTNGTTASETCETMILVTPVDPCRENVERGYFFYPSFGYLKLGKLFCRIIPKVIRGH